MEGLLSIAWRSVRRAGSGSYVTRTMPGGGLCGSLVSAAIQATA